MHVRDLERILYPRVREYALALEIGEAEGRANAPRRDGVSPPWLR